MDRDIPDEELLAKYPLIRGGSDASPEPADPAPDDGGEAPEPAADEPEAAPDSPEPRGETRERAPRAEAKEEHFVDPKSIPDELKPHWKRMHGAYNKAQATIRSRREDIALVDRYRQDPGFARDFLMQEGRRLGLHFAAPGQPAAAPQGAPTGTPGGDVPSQVLDAYRRSLPPELQWMAEHMARAQWTVNQGLVEPLARQNQEREVTTRVSQYEDLAAQLSEEAPGWESAESDMSELLDFLQSTRMHDRKWGSKLKLLYSLATGNASATRAAVQRMSEAARNRTTTGQPGRATVTNLEDRVRGARNSREALAIAAEEAARELKRAGVVIPE